MTGIISLQKSPCTMQHSVSFLCFVVYCVVKYCAFKFHHCTVVVFLFTQDLSLWSHLLLVVFIALCITDLKLAVMAHDCKLEISCMHTISKAEKLFLSPLWEVPDDEVPVETSILGA